MLYKIIPKLLKQFLSDSISSFDIGEHVYLIKGRFRP